MAPPWPPGQGQGNEIDPNFDVTITANPYGNNNGVFGAEYDADDQKWFQVPNYQTSTETIGQLEPLVRNQQPAHVSALADQFVKVALVFHELEKNLRGHSMKLFAEDWTQSDARLAFMQKGPGVALAYLQDWRTQMAMNIDALYDLVDPIQKSQTEMKNLWENYQKELKDAGNPSFLDTWVSGMDRTGQNAQQDDRMAKEVDKVKEKYDRLARELVERLSAVYRDQFFKMNGGVGTPYTIPNVVMAPPGYKWPMVGELGGVPNLTRPGGAPPNVAPPPVPPAINTSNLQRLANQVPTLTPPTTPTLPGAPNLNKLPPGPTVTTPSPGGPPGGPPVLPPLPPGMRSLNPRTVPNGLTAPNLNPVPGNGTGVTAPGTQPGVLPPPGFGRGVSRGVLGRPGSAPGFGALPPPGAGLGRRGALSREATVRSPAANYTATGTGVSRTASSPGVMPPPGAGMRQRGANPGMPVTRAGGLGTPAAFSQSSATPPVSPVLGRPGGRRGQQPGQQPGQQGGPRVAMRGAYTPPTAAPPVLDAASARAAGNALPPPAGIPPQQRSRRARGSGVDRGMPMVPGGFPPGRREGRYTGQPAPNLVGNPDWLAETGPDEAASTVPVLRNQMAASLEAGAMPPMMPSQGGVLNRPREAVRRAMADNRSRPGQQRQAPTEAELARRARETDHRGRSTEAPEARPGEEAAFTVQTPGGPVVGSTPARQEEAPRPTIGNG